MTRRLLSLRSLLLLAVACGTPVDTTYAGEPLVTLRGQASVTATDRPDGPVRLTLAWYPGLVDDAAARPSAPAGILTVDVAFTSTFPADFVLPLYQPPPRSALVEVGGLVRGRAATGILLAYRDVNGNGQLDTLPAEGGPGARDRVVGTSWGSAESFVLLYVEQAQAPETGLRRGLNLLRIAPAGGGVVPLTTPIPLALGAGGGPLDLFICEAAWDDTPDAAPPCGLDLEPPPPHPGTLRVEGTVALAGTRVTVDVLVSRDGEQLTGATVTLKDRVVPYVEERGAYGLDVEDPTLLTEGGTVTLRALFGEEETRRSLTVPGGFSITRPAPGAQVKGGAELTVGWTAAPGAEAYDVRVLTPEGMPLWQSYLTEVGTTFSPATHEGPATLSVSAVSRPAESERLGWLDVRLVRVLPLEFVP
jgi:hypothetical protein